MANSVFEVRIADTDVEESVHRLRNLAEDLYRQIEITGLGRVSEIDSLTTVIRIEIHDKSQTAAIRRVIQKQLRQHGFSDDIEIVKKH